MQKRLMHALDLAALGDWESAKRSLQDVDDPMVPRLVSLMTEQQRREKERAQRMQVVRHELGNALSIAQVNVEAMVDGLLEPTAERLAGIRSALHHCARFFTEGPRYSQPVVPDRAHAQTFNICELITAQVQFVAPVANSKNVTITSAACAASDKACMYRGDQDGTAQAVRQVLLSAVRFTPPGGAITIGCVHPHDEILLTVHDAAVSARAGTAGLAAFSRLLQNVGGHARMINDDADSATFFISLPSVA